MSDFLQMWTEGTAQHVARVADVGRTLTTGWEGAKSTIDGAVSGIGGDSVGQAFATGFLAASQAVRAACDQVPPGFEKLATGGAQCVSHYETTAATQAAQLNGL